MLFIVALFTLLFSSIQFSLVQSTLSASDIIIDCNTYYRYTSHAGAPTLFLGSRIWAFTNILFHDILNILNPKYNQFFKTKISMTSPYLLNSQWNKAAIMLGICYKMRLFSIDHTYNAWSPGTLLYDDNAKEDMLDDLDLWVNPYLLQLKSEYNNNMGLYNFHVLQGYTYGQNIASYILNEYDNDGWKAVVTPVVGTFPYEPGKWYSMSETDGISLDSRGEQYPQFANMNPLGIGSSTRFSVPPRPALDTSIFYNNYLETLNHGNKTDNNNKIRTEYETIEALTIGTLTPTEWNNLILHTIIDQNKNLIIDDRDISYLYAQQSLNSYDAPIFVYYWKNYYLYDRPIQLIHYGAGNKYNKQYPAYGNSWTNLLYPFSSPEYPAGHPTESSTGIESIRLALKTIGLIPLNENTYNGLENDNKIPGGAITICYGPFADFTVQYDPNTKISCSNYITLNSFNEFKDKVVRARVSGGMHYPISGRIGKLFANQIAKYNVETHMTKL